MSELHRLKVYVAGNPHDDEVRIREFMDWLKSSSGSFVLTYDWLEEYKNRPQTITEEAKTFLRREAAKADLQAVAEANVLVLFDAPQGWGMYVEMGAALGAGKRVIVIAPFYRQVFFYHPNVTVVQTDEEARKYLEDLYSEMTFPL